MSKEDRVNRVTIKTGHSKGNHKTGKLRGNIGHHKTKVHKVSKGLRKTGMDKINSIQHKIGKARDNGGLTRQQAGGRVSQTGSNNGQPKIVATNPADPNKDLIITKKKNSG